MKQLLSAVFIVALVAGCGPTNPSTNMVQTAIAQTQASMPQATNTPIPPPTETPTPEPTPTVTPEPSPTPDTRVIITNPQKMLPTSKEMPKEGYYVLPNEGWMTVNTNEEVISTRGVEEGRSYVIETGRVTGWIVGFYRSVRGAQMPEEVWFGVYQFKSTEGANLAITKFGSHVLDPNNYDKIDTTCTFGPTCVDYYTLETQSNGTVIMNRDVMFTYHNLIVNVGLYGLDTDITDDFIASMVNLVMNKIDSIAEYGTADAFK